MGLDLQMSDGPWCLEKDLLYATGAENAWPQHTKFAIVTNAPKYATEGVLMQEDTNGDWKPCAFLSHFLDPTKWNYRIYDWKLLGVIHVLKEWRHYFHSSPHPVKVRTNHKNSTYFWQPQNLNCCQTCWLFDLYIFNLQHHSASCSGQNLVEVHKVLLGNSELNLD